MPSSTLLRATFFALGAAAGGGAVAVLNASKKKEVPNTTQASPPLVEVGVTGDPRFSARATTAVGPVLKYGNPGNSGPGLVTSSLTLRPCVGPVSDQLVRQAYVAAYDRRLRHPAWVS
jgi:endonuclease G